jgi:hypothetical protein
MTARTKLTIVALFLLLQTLDILTTYAGLRAGAQEANVLPAWLLATHGEAAMYAVKAVLVLAVLGVVLWLDGRLHLWPALRITNVLMIGVVALNLTALV